MNAKKLEAARARAEAVAQTEFEEAVLRITTRLHSDPDQDPLIAIWAIGTVCARFEDRMRLIFVGIQAGKPLAEIAQGIGLDPAVTKQRLAESRSDIERTARLLEVPFRLPEDEPSR